MVKADTANAAKTHFLFIDFSIERSTKIAVSLQLHAMKNTDPRIFSNIETQSEHDYLDKQQQLNNHYETTAKRSYVLEIYPKYYSKRLDY